eukprot:2116152-Rhodomonas_salina.1
MSADAHAMRCPVLMSRTLFWACARATRYPVLRSRACYAMSRSTMAHAMHVTLQHTSGLRSSMTWLAREPCTRRKSHARLHDFSARFALGKLRFLSRCELAERKQRQARHARMWPRGNVLPRAVCVR